MKIYKGGKDQYSKEPLIWQKFNQPVLIQNISKDINYGNTNKMGGGIRPLPAFTLAESDHVVFGMKSGYNENIDDQNTNLIQWINKYAGAGAGNVFKTVYDSKQLTFNTTGLPNTPLATTPLDDLLIFALYCYTHQHSWNVLFGYPHGQWLNNQDSRLLFLINIAIFKAPKPKISEPPGYELYSGLSAVVCRSFNLDFEDAEAKHKLCIFPCFRSFTTDKNIAVGFVGGVGPDGRVGYVLKVLNYNEELEKMSIWLGQSNTWVGNKSISAYAYEKELLFPTGTTFTVAYIEDNVDARGRVYKEVGINICGISYIRSMHEAPELSDERRLLYDYTLNDDTYKKIRDLKISDMGDTGPILLAAAWGLRRVARTYNVLYEYPYRDDGGAVRGGSYNPKTLTKYYNGKGSIIKYSKKNKTKRRKYKRKKTKRKKTKRKKTKRNKTRRRR